MRATLRRLPVLPLLLATLALCACASHHDPAQQQLDAIASAIAAASPDAARYVPGRLAQVQARLATLRAGFARQEYDAVLTAAPALLTDAQELLGAAAQARTTAERALQQEWPGLAGTLPQWLEALQKRIDVLAKARKTPAGVDLAAARTALEEARSLWSRAQAAFAAGNIAEAVATAHTVRERAAAAAAALRMPLPA